MANPTAPPHLRIDLDALPVLNLAMLENAIPLVPRISITNQGEAPVRDIVVTASLEPGYSAPWTARIAELEAGATYHLDDVGLGLDKERFVNIVEREAGTLRVTAGAAVETVAVQVLAYNEWIGGLMPPLLAAFVMPNHPAVMTLLKGARPHLAELSGSPAFDGYQSGDPARTAAIAAAIYRAIQDAGVTYINPPASFERTGQKIRTPEQVLSDQMGTCLDLTVLFASCLEQCGLHPLLVLVDGHAFPGVWLGKEEIPEAVIDDAAMLRKLVDLNRMLVFDSSAVAQEPRMTFDRAVRAARESLGEAEGFRYAVCVYGARLQQFLPLPVRTSGYQAVEWEAGTAPVGPDPVRSARSSVLDDIRAAAGRARPEASAKAIPRVERWKQRLLDTTLRNKLINFKSTKQSLRLICPDISALEDLLAGGSEFRLAPRPQAFGDSDVRDRKKLEDIAQDDAAASFLRERMDRGELYTVAEPDAIYAHLTGMWRAARTSLEESGTNTLCLAMGFLRWYESPTSTLQRCAPILLIPVSLRRDTRSSSFYLQSSDDDTRLNITLLEKIRHDLSITIPELEALPEDESGVDVRLVLRLVREAVLNLPRWDVVDDLQLGHFSFAKFLMWTDLEQRAGALLDSPVVKHLALGAADAYPDQGAFPQPAELDARYAPAEILCPLDNDASQLAAVAAAAQGKSFVLQGPPGTGKSQTITNVIAHCLAEGKRVLFVSEKMAALEVVHRRLSQIGLGPYCLELHSHKAGKKQVLEDLRVALEAAELASPADWDEVSGQLEAERAALNRYAEAVHRPRELGCSVFQGLSRLIGLREAPDVAVELAAIDSREALSAAQEAASRLEEAAGLLPPIAGVSWLGCELPGWSLALPDEVAAAIAGTRSAAGAVRAAAGELAPALGLAATDDLAALADRVRVGELLESNPGASAALLAADDWARVEPESQALVRLASDHASARGIMERYEARLLELDLPALLARFGRYAGAFFLIAWWMLRGARASLAPLRRDGRLPGSKEVLRDLEKASAYQKLADEVREREARAQSLFGPAWEEDSEALAAQVAWASGFHAAAGAIPAEQRPALLAAAQGWQPGTQAVVACRQALLTLETALGRLEALLGWKRVGCDDLAACERQLDRWTEQAPLLREWFVYLEARAELAGRGGGPLIAALEEGSLATAEIRRAFDRGVFKQWTSAAIAGEPALARFHGTQHLQRVRRFAELDRAHVALSAGAAVARVSARAPSSGGPVTKSSELGILMRELEKKRRHKPIRALLKEIPSLVAKLKPCFLMSPMSVAQYLDPECARFDLVVFDEASQIPTHDAIGALARADSAVIVGDSRQLPPTTFFQAADDDDDAADESFEELESILDECIAARLPQRRLDWHYRSRHESLIAFSNYHYYDNRLNTFPSAAAHIAGLGVSLREVRGSYDKGGSRTNRAEADAVVAEVVRRLRDPDQARRSIGIVTFSQAQQSLIEDLLDRARREHPDIDGYFEGADEPLIVKNLENIQGDERDVMMFSICYGPDAAGKVSMNFGPMNRDGGERRLNVAVTRAREELIVFSTLRADQIDLSRTRAVGVKHLKTFLDYAGRGPAAIAEATAVSGEAEFDSPFEAEVHALLTRRGWAVDTQVGCAGYRIDLGVKDPRAPGRYLVGVECDGAYYHSARSARERDRLRAQVLEGLGWKLYRIWSTDWWYDREGQLARLEAHLDELAAAQVESLPVVGAVAPAPPPPPAVVAPAPESAERVYEEAAVPAGVRQPEDVYAGAHAAELRTVALQVIAAEAPITLRLLARRIAPYFTLSRTSKKLEDRLRAVLGDAAHLDGAIAWRTDQSAADYQSYRVPSATDKRDAPDIPVVEIVNAALPILRNNIAIDEPDLIREVARVFGFARTGGRVTAHMGEGINSLVARGLARREDGRVILA